MAQSMRVGIQLKTAASSAQSSVRCACLPPPKIPEGQTRLLHWNRRVLLATSVSLAAGWVRGSKALGGGWSSTGLAAPEDDLQPRFSTTPGGVKVEQLSHGAGPAAKLGDTLEIDYVWRRPSGYFIYSTASSPSDLPFDIPTGPIRLKLGDDAVIAGLSEALQGLQAGSKIKAVIPPDLGYLDQGMKPSPPTYGAKRLIARHTDEPLMFEVKVLKVVPPRG